MPQIRMLENVWQGSTLLAAGSDVTVTTELADQLVGAGKALDTAGYKSALVDQTMTDDVQRAKVAAVVGAGRITRFPGAIWRPCSGTYAGGGPAGRTWQHIAGVPSKPFALRVGYVNPLTSAVTIDKTNAVMSSSFVPSGDPTGGATPVSVLFGGSASVVLPAAASVEVETITMSDWTAISPVDWTGVVNLALMYIRSYIVNSGYAYISSANLAAYPQNVLGGYVRQASFATGDYIATPTGFVGTGSNQVALPMILETRDISASVRGLGIGDSTSNNSTYISGGAFNNWGEQMCRSLNASGSRWYSYANAGWSSQGIRGGSAGAYPARLAAALAANEYDVVFIQTYSPNNAPSTQAALDADINAVLTMIAQVRAHGAVPILSAGIPAVALNATADAFRVQSNEIFRRLAAAMRIPFVDINSLVSNGATPARLLASVSSDGTHITTDYGISIEVEARKRAMLSVFP